MTDFRATLGIALEELLKHLESLNDSPVAPSTDLPTLRRRLAKPLAEDGMPPEQAVMDLVRDTAGGHLGGG